MPRAMTRNNLTCPNMRGRVRRGRRRHRRRQLLILQSLGGHSEGSGLYAECNKTPVKHLTQKSEGVGLRLLEEHAGIPWWSRG